MPIRPNLLERAAFYHLNAAPAPMLDLAGALAFQTLYTAVQLNLFDTLQTSSATITTLTKRLTCHQRGLQKLLNALVALGYLSCQNGRYANTPLTEKWLLNNDTLDLKSSVYSWQRFLIELWPHAPEIVQSGERPFHFYNFVASDPALSHAFQKMMVGNANIIGPDVVKRIKLPTNGGYLLDVGGGHGAFTVQFCRANPQLQATIIDSAAALETAKQYIASHHLEKRITPCAGDIWQMDWEPKYDLILLFNFIHHYDMPTNKKLPQKVKAALKPNGQVAILDQLEGTVLGSATNTLIQLVGFMYYIFADGRTFSREEVGTMLMETGFRNISYHTSAKWAGTSLVVARC